MHETVASERKYWLDNVKALGILSVVLGHIATPLTSFIYSWHMPLFFILGGYLLGSGSSLKEYVHKNFNRIMIPYFIFSLVALTAELLKIKILDRNDFEVFEYFMGVFLWMDYSSLQNTYAFVLWFLPTLFIGKIFVFLITTHINNFYYNTIIVFLLFIFGLKIDLPLALDNAFTSLIFIYFGYLIKSSVSFSSSACINLFFISLIVLSGLFYAFGLPGLDMANKYYSNFGISVVWPFVFSIFIFSFFILVKLDNEVFSMWGRNTIIVMVLHPYTNNVSHILIDYFGNGYWYFKFLLSLVLLQIILMLKVKYERSILFRWL